MATHDRDQVKLDADTVGKGLCPECLVSLNGLNVAGHAENHWPDRTMDPRYHADALRRKRLLTRYADEHSVKEAE